MLSNLTTYLYTKVLIMSTKLAAICYFKLDPSMQSHPGEHYGDIPMYTMESGNKYMLGPFLEEFARITSTMSDRDLDELATIFGLITQMHRETLDLRPKAINPQVKRVPKFEVIDGGKE